MFDQFLSKASELLAKGEPFAVAEVVRYLSRHGESGGRVAR